MFAPNGIATACSQLSESDLSATRPVFRKARVLGVPAARHAGRGDDLDRPF